MLRCVLAGLAMFAPLSLSATPQSNSQEAAAAQRQLAAAFASATFGHQTAIGYFSDSITYTLVAAGPCYSTLNVNYRRVRSGNFAIQPVRSPIDIISM